MAEGLRYVLGHAYLKNIAACTATANLFGDAFRQVAYGAPGDNVVVVLSLRGGSDGISTTLPSTSNSATRPRARSPRCARP